MSGRKNARVSSNVRQSAGILRPIVHISMGLQRSLPDDFVRHSPHLTVRKAVHRITDGDAPQQCEDCGALFVKLIFNRNHASSIMESELGRTVISAISALSEMVIAYRSRSESNKVLSEVQTEQAGPSSDPWRWRTEATFISDEELDQIVANTEASSEAGKILAALVPEAALREILEHIDEETTKLRESMADSGRSKGRRQRDIDHAEAEICVELKTIRRHNGNAIPEVPRRALAKAWEQHRCS